MKKLLQTVLVCFLAVSIVGCSAKDTSNKQDNTQGTVDGTEESTGMVETEDPIEKILSETIIALLKLALCFLRISSKWS